MSSMMSDSQEIELNAYIDTDDISPLIESGTSKPSKDSVDVLISKVGQCGLYQVLVCFIICLANIPMTYQILIMYFTGHSPNWRCTNVTSTLCNFTKEVSSAEVELYYSRCKMPRDNWDYVTPRNFSLITEFDLVCDKNSVAAFANSALYIGWGLGCIPLGIAAGNYGRKLVLFISYGILLSSVLASAFITSIWQFIILRLVTGFGITGQAVSSYVLTTEAVGGKYRSITGNLLFLVGTGGLLLLTLQGYYIREWRKLTIVCSAPYFALFVGLVCIDESARWLKSQGKLEKSSKVFSKMAKINGQPSLDIEIDHEIIDQDGSTHEKKNQGSFTSLFRSKKRLCITIPLCFSWMVVGMTFYGIALLSGDLGGNMYRDFALTSLVEFPAMVVTIILLEKIGRKKTAILAMAGAGLFCCSIIFFPGSSSNKVYSTVRIVAGMAAKLCNVVAFSAYYVWTVELHPTTIRTQGLSFASLLARVGCTTSPFIAEVLKLVYSSLPFLIMGVLSLIAGFTSFCLPDTTGDSTRELQDMPLSATPDQPVKSISNSEEEIDWSDENNTNEDETLLVRLNNNRRRRNMFK